MNNLDFNGRVAIVTGAGQGMGREHAKMLASRGHAWWSTTSMRRTRPKP